MAAHGRHDDPFHIADVETKARRCRPVDDEVQEITAGAALGKGAASRIRGALILLQRIFNGDAGFLDGGQVRPEHLDAQRRTNPGGEHFGARLDRHTGVHRLDCGSAEAPAQAESRVAIRRPFTVASHRSSSANKLESQPEAGHGFSDNGKHISRILPESLILKHNTSRFQRQSGRYRRSTMATPQLEHVQHKLEHLAPERLAEVEDFIDFLRQRDREQRLRRDYAQASEPAFGRVWDNDEDAVYDEL